MISLLITLLIIVIVFGLVVWLLGALPISPPFKNAAYAILVAIIIIWLLGMLLVGPVHWPYYR